jgi:protein-S-isoprenylcysteine O-methyltransferase Ste14
MIKLLLQLFKTGTIVDTVQGLFQSKIENIKMDFYKKLSDVLASIVLIIIISFVGLMMMLFLGFGLSFYLNLLLESTYLGFVIVGGLFFIAAWIMSFTIRTGYLQKKLYQAMMTILDKKNDSI